MIPQPITKQTQYPCNSVQVLDPVLQEKFLKTTQQKQDPAGTVRRFAAVMNQKKLWIICVKVSVEGPPGLVILYELENTMPLERIEVFSTCCIFGEGFMRASGNQLRNQLLLVCCWGRMMFYVELVDQWAKMLDINFPAIDNTPIYQHAFKTSVFIDFKSRILSLNFLEPSLCLVFTHHRGLFVINSINFRNFKDNKTDIDINALNFKELTQFQLLGQEIHYPSAAFLSARKKFRTAVYSLLKSKKKFEYLIADEEKTINYVQSMSACPSPACQTIVALYSGGLVLAKMASWTKQMSTFYADGEWLNGMHYVVSIYRGENRFITKFL